VAVDHGHEGVADLLLSNNADVNAKTNDGSTPLLMAAYKGSRDVAELLLDSGADLNAKDGKYGLTALRWATGQHHDDVVKLLRQRGAKE
jgi:ankyrin repeat protein